MKEQSPNSISSESKEFSYNSYLNTTCVDDYLIYKHNYWMTKSEYETLTALMVFHTLREQTKLVKMFLMMNVNDFKAKIFKIGKLLRPIKLDTLKKSIKNNKVFESVK